MNHIIALSGGKDSTAMALRLSETEPRDYIYICTPTGDELPEMTEHWSTLENILNSPIIRVKHPVYPDFKSLCEGMKCLPNFRQRFCTRILKIETAQAFYAELDPCISYVGFRADEPERTGIVGSDDTRYPLREWGWGLDEVWGYLKEKKITVPARTDCARCFYQRIDEWWWLWKAYPEIFNDAVMQEKQFGHTFLTKGKFGKTWPHDLKSMRAVFETGKTPRKAKIYYPMFEPEQDDKCRICRM